MTAPADPDVGEIARGLTEAQRRNLLALSEQWQTVSEMRPYGATGSGMDILYVMHHRHRICDRRWTTWGDEPGQRRGEGYEYRIEPLGLAVRQHLTERSGK